VIFYLVRRLWRRRKRRALARSTLDLLRASKSQKVLLSTDSPSQAAKLACDFRRLGVTSRHVGRDVYVSLEGARPCL
jgi:hypothetical protein